MDKENIFLSHMRERFSDKNLRTSKKVVERSKYILNILQGPKINLHTLQAVCFHGIPDELSSLRALCWKVLLGYLPENTSKWQSTLDDHRKNYGQYVEIIYAPFIAAFSEFITKKKALKAQKAKEEDAKEHANSENETSSPSRKLSLDQILLNYQAINNQAREHTYAGFGADEDLWDNVTKDTRRTRSEMDFFQRETDEKRESDDILKPKGSHETRDEVLARMLFIYAKLNPGVSYVQGMNEIMAPIYYSFSHDKSPAFVGHSEADTFFCFSILMGEVQDAFIKGLDNTEVGIQGRMKSLNSLLKTVDEDLWAHLERFNMNPQFYSLRWLMLLLTQEFEITEVVRLWDSMLSHPQRLVFLNYMCLAMMTTIQEKLMSSDDFAELIELLQKGTSKDLDLLLGEASRLYREYTKPEERVYHIGF